MRKHPDCDALREGCQTRHYRGVWCMDSCDALDSQQGGVAEGPSAAAPAGDDLALPEEPSRWEDKEAGGKGWPVTVVPAWAYDRLLSLARTLKERLAEHDERLCAQVSANVNLERKREQAERKLAEAERSRPKCDLCGEPADFDERTCYRCAKHLYGDEPSPERYRNEDERLDDPRHEPYSQQRPKGGGR